jgi:hypothetical protein
MLGDMLVNTWTVCIRYIYIYIYYQIHIFDTYIKSDIKKERKGKSKILCWSRTRKAILRQFFVDVQIVIRKVIKTNDSSQLEQAKKKLASIMVKSKLSMKMYL